MNARSGHLRFPHALADMLDERIRSPAQRWVLAALASEAQWQAKTVRVRDVTAHVDVGEVLVSSRAFSDRHRLGAGASGEKGRLLFRRALDAGEGAGIVATRPALALVSDPPSDPRAVPDRNPRSDPPPTIVRFLVFRAEMWGPVETRPTSQPASQPTFALEPDPIQDPSKDKDVKDLAPAAPSRAPGNPAFRELQDALCADFQAVTGERYAWQSAKDTQALKRLIAHGADAIRERWGRGLRASGFHRVRTVAQLGSKWNDLADGTAAGAAQGVGRFDEYTGPVDIRTGKPLSAGVKP